MSNRNIGNQDIDQLNQFAVFLSFKITPIIRRYLNCPHKLIGLFTGNQAMKTSSTAYSCVLRIMGRHPVPEKNLDYFKCDCGGKWNFRTVPKDRKCPECGGAVTLWSSPIRVLRFASETLPGETTDAKGDESTEVKNTQYPEFKKWLPEFMLKKDIRARSPKMVVKSGLDGPDVIVEFVSYNQSVQSTAGSQRFLIWCDEEPSKAFYDEQLPRLLASDGDFIVTLTPANEITWTYDEIFERASVYYRSKAIADKFKLKEYEKVRDDNQIAVIQAATDDNPTLRPDVIERKFEKYDDPDLVAIRRYGIFKQISGRVFKCFDWNIHVIQEDRYFPEGVPRGGVHARGVDYHERTPWGCGWFYLSNENELFIYDELNPSPEQLVTSEISFQMASKSRDYRYRLDLIDPLAQKTQGNTGTSVVDDMNRLFLQYKREGIGTGAYWQPWDTKGARGRDAATERLKNSVECGKPFNNVRTKDGATIYLPTLWIFSRCKNFANSFKNWRWEEWAGAVSAATKEDKNSPQQRWSHFPMTVEALLKDVRFCPARSGFWRGVDIDRKQYFKRERGYA